MTLHLPPSTAAFFGLPERVLVPAADSAGPLTDEGRRAELPALAEGLQAAVEAGTEMASLPEVHRFLRRWPLYQDLDRYLKQGNLTFAEAVARNILADGSSDAPSLSVLALARAGESRWEEALERVEEAQRAAPGHGPIQLQLALILAGLGRRDEALGVLQALAERPGFASTARLWRYEVQVRSPHELSGSLARSLRTLLPPTSTASGETPGNAADAFPGNPELLYLEAVRDLASREPDASAASEERLERVLELDPDHVPARAALVRLRVTRGALEDARACLEEGLGRAPGDPHLLLVSAQLQEREERPEAAREVYHSIFRGPLAQLPPVVVAAAGHALLRLEPEGRLGELFEDLASSRPGDPLPHQLLARWVERSGDSVRAERLLREAQQTCGPQPPLVYALGDLLRRGGRTVEAEGLFHVLVRRHPNSPWGYRGLGDLQVETSPAEALEQYLRALELDPDLPIPGYDYLRGVSALRGGDAPGAQRWLRRAVLLEPDNARYWCDLGAVSFFQGNLDHALSATERALRLRPGHPGFLHNLAAYLHERFRRNPWRYWRSGWRAWRLRRKLTGSDEAWRRDLWPPPPTAEPRHDG